MKRTNRNAKPRPTVRIAIATTPADIVRCHAVMRELRPDHANEKSFLRQVRRQQREGFRLAFVEIGGQVCAVAGYRILNMLFSGPTLYVDDLVTREAERSRGFGGQLFDWLVEQGRKDGCQSLSLDSGVHRFDAHRFYLMKRMKIASHHFSLDL